MRKLRAFFLRFCGFFRVSRSTDDFDAEMESHVGLDTEDGIRAGLSPKEARRRALIRLGGAEQTRQGHRERQTLPRLESVTQDVRFALRTMGRKPGFTGAVVLTLAIGIGAGTAIFSAIKPILIDPLPYPNAGRLMMLWELRRDGAPSAVTFGTFEGLSQRSRSFDALAVFKPWSPAATATSQADRPERIAGQRVSADYFRTLGVAPRLGRDFEPSEDRFRGPNVVLLSDGLWRRRFGADPDLVGKTARLDDAIYTVVGILPRGFENVVDASAEIWAPLQYDPSLPWDGREWGHHLRMIGRLKAGVSRDEAGNELSVILHGLAQTYAKGYNSSGGAPDGILVRPLQGDLTREVRPALLAVLGAVLLVLTIACVNVANLLLARGSQRQAEFAMRAALGAPAGRVARQLLTESLMLSLLGGALGIAVAEAGVRALLALSPPGMPRIHAITVDGAVLAFAICLTSLIGIAVGMVSSWQASRGDPQAGLRQGTARPTGGRHRTRQILVVTEVSLAMVLLVSSGLLLRSMRRLLAVDPGFDAAGLLTMQVQEWSGRSSDSEARLQFFQQALDKVRRIPGVVSAGFTSQLPLGGDADGYGIQFEKDNNPLGDPAYQYSVSPGYFKAMGIPLRHGRLLNEGDIFGAPVAVLISQSLADREFAGQDPVGQHVRLGPDAGRADRPWATIVGVVGNVRQESLSVAQEDAFYTTAAQWLWLDNAQSLVVRTDGRARPARVFPAVEEAIWSVDGNRLITRVATMETLRAATEVQRRFVLVLFEGFGLVALVLAAIGIYGILSGSVSERIREIGVRAALGAGRRDLLLLILRQGMAMTGIGLAIGLCFALAAGRALEAMLFGVSWLDGATYLGAAVLLLAISGIACFIPARRAASIDPMQALRTE